MEHFARPASELAIPRLGSLQVAAAPSGGQGLSLTDTGKVPASVLPMRVAGRVSGAGAVVAGSGFTVAYNGVSTYTITFTVSFAEVPVVNWQATAGSTQFALSSVTVNGFVAVTQGAAPSDFNFIAQAVT